MGAGQRAGRLVAAVTVALGPAVAGWGALAGTTAVAAATGAARPSAVGVTESDTPAFTPPAGCTGGGLASEQRGERGRRRPRRGERRGPVLRLHHRHGHGEQSPGPGVGLAGQRLRLLHRPLLRLERPAGPTGLGGSPTPRPRRASSPTTASGSCSTTPPRPATPATPATTACRWPPPAPSPPATPPSSTARRPGCSASPPARSTPAPTSTRLTGQAYLVWKQNDGGSSAPAYLWSQPLSSTGTPSPRAASPTELMYNDTVAYPWETTVEDPAMVYDDGTWYLLFSAGQYTSAAYSEAITTCAGPSGPCGAPTQIVTSYGAVPRAPAAAPCSPTPRGTGGSTTPGGRAGAPAAPTTHAGPPAGSTSRPSTCRRRRAPPPTPRSPAPPRRCPPATASWPSDGGIFDFGNLPFCGSMGGQPLNRPVVAMAATPSGGGYWEVAADGGLFSFGDARFFGSMGGKPLVAPIVGMAATPSGGGYWEVAADGGLFAFGDARFFGSMGGRPLNQPIVGMAATPYGRRLLGGGGRRGALRLRRRRLLRLDGRAAARPARSWAWPATPDGAGYWEVGTDGGLFAFGHAPSTARWAGGR